jgi:hypothetical protein
LKLRNAQIVAQRTTREGRGVGTPFGPSAFKAWRAVASKLTLTPSTAEVTVATNFWEVPMKTVIEGNQEATKALTLAGAGVIIAMLMWTLMMLLFY